MFMATALLSYLLVFVVLWSYFAVLYDTTTLLVLCGDVLLNPGPNTRYPCAMCYCPVRWNQKALLCDVCNHCKCCSVSDMEYLRYQGLKTFSCCCPSCVVKMMPFHDCSVLTSSDAISVYSDDNSFDSLVFPQRSGGVRIAHLNCRSLLPHKEEILTLMCDGYFDMLALTETWLDDTISDCEIFPAGSGVSLMRLDRNRHGGGVAFVVSNQLRVCVRPDLHEGNVESLWVELFPRTKRSLLLCCVYRPPSKVDFYDLFASECEKIIYIVLRIFGGF